MKNVSWEDWHKVSEREFNVFNRTHNSSMELTDIYSDFVDTFKKCMEEVIPKKEVRISGRRKRPPWYSEEVQAARH